MFKNMNVTDHEIILHFWRTANGTNASDTTLMERFIAGWVAGWVLALALPIIVVNVVGNICTVFAFFMDSSIRACNQNIYIVNLAFTDLAVGLVSIPFGVYYTMADWHWGLSTTACKFWLTVDLWVVFEASLTLILISYDRMLMIIDGEGYNIEQFRRLAIRNLIITWIFSFIAYGPLVMGYDIIRGHSILESGECHVEYDDLEWFTKIYAVIEFVLPFISITFFCLMIGKSLINKRRAVDRRSNFAISEVELEKEQHLAKALFIMVITYFICWTPFSFSEMVWSLCTHCGSRNLHEVFIWIVWFNAAINPFHYAHADASFRANYKRMLCPWKHAVVETKVYDGVSLTSLNAPIPSHIDNSGTPADPVSTGPSYTTSPRAMEAATPTSVHLYHHTTK